MAEGERLEPPGDRPGRAVGLRQVAARRPPRAADAAARRLLPGRRRPRRCRGSTWPAASPIVDWDDPASWNLDAAVSGHRGALPDRVHATRRSTTSRRAPARATGSSTSPASAYFVAEGIFAQEVVGECRRRGLLADAVCVTQHPALTFVRRLTRDLREHRKPPFVLVRRGLHLLLAQRAVVAHAQEPAAAGCSRPRRPTARSGARGRLR